ncbi:MAG TPA: hypothetical protein VFR78_03790 [Pyrinomonadaceae bacterium]|nr:hypothetical protein [Pyrinomonadaceae bacterium]
MRVRVGFLICVVLICLQSSAGAFVAVQRARKAPRVRTISLEKFGEYPNQYRHGTFKIRNVVLEDIRPAGERDPVSVLQVYEPRSGARRGEPIEDEPFHPWGFLICTGPDIGNVLAEQKDKWLKQRVNLYAQMRDVGLTVFHYTGYVMKIELLDAKGKVVQTLEGKLL